MNRNVTVRLNVLGVDLNRTQINAVLDQEDPSVAFQRDWLTSFFRLKKSELTKELLCRYAQADVRMKRISAGTYEEDIHTRLIDILASAKRCYSYGEFFACVELCALHGEMLANYLCITSRDVLFQDSVINSLSSCEQKNIRKQEGTKFFSDKLNQRLRLKWLKNGEIIVSEDNDHLEIVHNLRIRYFHHWSSNRTSIEEDALTALSEVSQVSANYLELLGHNEENLNRVKQYMKIVDEL